MLFVWHAMRCQIKCNPWRLFYNIHYSYCVFFWRCKVDKRQTRVENCAMLLFNLCFCFCFCFVKQMLFADKTAVLCTCSYLKCAGAAAFARNRCGKIKNFIIAGEMSGKCVFENCLLNLWTYVMYAHRKMNVISLNVWIMFYYCMMMLMLMNDSW